MKLLYTFILLFCSFFSFAKEFVLSDVNGFNETMSTVKAGDVIVWKNGKYSDVRLQFHPVENGSESLPIILKAETAGKVSFTGKSKISIGGSYLQVEGFLFEGPCTFNEGDHVIDFRSNTDEAWAWAEHCRVTNCAIIDYTPTEVSGIMNYHVNLVGRNNELDHCYFKGKINKGPTVVVEYKQEKGYVPGSDVAPSTAHHIHHNYFGYRTYSANGGEQLRVGTSTTSFSHGFNIVEYNYFEDERIEAEIISNKSSDNIYRFNTFIGNDGALVIRHGHKCFVYGNYINGKTGKNQSGGIRVVNPDNTVFNNYIEEAEGGAKSMKAPIAIMSGLKDGPLNGYYPADNAIVAYNTVVNSVGPVINIGLGNSSNGLELISPKNVLLVGNVILDTKGKDNAPIKVEGNSTYTLKGNFYNSGETSLKGFGGIASNDFSIKDGFSYVNQTVNQAVVDSIKERLSLHKIKLTEKEITWFNPKWKLSKNDVGVSWIK